MFTKRKIDFIAIFDWLETRYNRVREKILEVLYKCKLNKRIPPNDLDFTEMMDRADKQNKWSDLFNNKK